jgi:adenylate cyclase
MRPPRIRLRLTQLFALTFGAVAAIVGLLFALLLISARSAVVARSEGLREDAASRIDARITRDLGEAGEVVADVERAVRAGAVDTRTADACEAPLFALLLDHPDVADVSLTHPDRWQVSVFRGTAANGGPLLTRVVHREGDRFVADLRTRAPGEALRAGAVSHGEATDPTAHPTYETAVSKGIYGAAIWSDLHYSELDQALPEGDRRVVVTVQKAIDDTLGKPAGVIRVGILARTVDDIAKMKVDEASADDPHRVFLCDADGRLLTRLAPDDPLASSDGDLRVASSHVTPAIARALASPLLRRVSTEAPLASEGFDVGGRRFLLTLRALGDTQGWIAAILVPEDHYTRDLRALLDRVVAIDAIGAACALLGGLLVLARVRGGFQRLLATTSRMRDFDFAADARPASLRDVDEVVQGLERAKTAMRALGKYVPVDLVRELYAANREPALGGELARLTLMFTDIRGFTDLSERLPPAELAQALGLYLQAMTTAIRETGGTIDKFIGDAVMAMWNAPSPVPRHAERACAAALSCADATARLYASEAWRGLPPLTTRFGLHTDDVLVGHFGSLDRFSYTALGDGVNLAARLESLCKQYGVVRSASEAVEEQARGSFAFRKLDRVAVKGKSRAVLVFELLGPAGMERGPAIAAYEAALEHYFAGRFAEALAGLTPHADADPPSKVLADRCRAFLVEPPPAGWDGTWVARSK